MAWFLYFLLEGLPGWWWWRVGQLVLVFLSDVGALAVFTWLEDQNLSLETAGIGKMENSSVSIGIGRDSLI